jgi:hypothetical protein
MLGVCGPEDDPQLVHGRAVLVGIGVYVGVGVGVGGQGVKVGVTVHAAGQVAVGVLVGVTVLVGMITCTWGSGVNRAQPANDSNASAKRVEPMITNDWENALLLPILWDISSSLPISLARARGKRSDDNLAPTNIDIIP